MKIRVIGQARPTSSLLVMLAALATGGCGDGDVLDGKTLAVAHEKWKAAKVPDYDLEWVSRGERKGHFLVYHRDGATRQVRDVQPDGREMLLEPEQWQHDVEGLFTLLEQELKKPAATSRSRRGGFNPLLGFPTWFRRDPAGTNTGLEIDIIRLDPTPTRKEPPLPPPPR